MNTNKDIQRLKCIQIKKLVERISGVPDIGIKSRKRYVADLRKSYCYLSKTFTKASYEIIGGVIREGFDHSSVTNNIKQFNLLEPLGALKCMEEYEFVFFELNHLKSIFKDIEDDIKKTYEPNPELRFLYINTLTKIMYKSHSVITNQRIEMSELNIKIKELEKVVIDNLDTIVLDN